MESQNTVTYTVTQKSKISKYSYIYSYPKKLNLKIQLHIPKTPNFKIQLPKIMAHVPGVHDFQILPKIQLPKMTVHVFSVHDFQILSKIQLPFTVTSN